MIFPLCQNVGVNNAFFREGRPSTDLIYFTTRFVLVFDGPGQCGIYEIESTPRDDSTFMRNLAAVRQISDPGRTLVYGQAVDLDDRPGLVRTACRLCKGGIDTVVFAGIDQHLTFVHEPSLEALAIIEVYDTVPPGPSKLAHCLKKLEDAGMFGEPMLAFDYRITDLRQFEDPGRTTVFPCHVEGLSGLFMNSLDAEPQGEIRLVGCNKTANIFRERFPGKAFEHVNTCPLARARPERPFLLRCCQPENAGPVEIDGVPGMAVEWGASPPAVYAAVQQLARMAKAKKVPCAVTD